MTTREAWMRTVRCLVAAAMLAAAFAACGDDPEAGWELAWEDDFVGSAGTPPDPARWRYDIGTDWGNAQLEFDTDRVENVALDGQGNLAIVARRESWMGRDYTSGRITTFGLFAQTRGRFEARIRLPIGRGIWPAFWLLGNDFPTVGWPACGEIDIMEYRGQEPRVAHGSLHGPGYSGGNAISRSYTLPSGTFDADFHVFSVQWDGDRIAWYVDGTFYHVVTREDLPPGGTWVFDHPFFIILNVAVGGNYVGPPDAGTVFPQTMLVDWVRVWRSAG